MPATLAFPDTPLVPLHDWVSPGGQTGYSLFPKNGYYYVGDWDFITFQAGIHPPQNFDVMAIQFTWANDISPLTAAGFQEFYMIPGGFNPFGPFINTFDIPVKQKFVRISVLPSVISKPPAAPNPSTAAFVLRWGMIGGRRSIPLTRVENVHVPVILDEPTITVVGTRLRFSPMPRYGPIHFFARIFGFDPMADVITINTYIIRPDGQLGRITTHLVSAIPTTTPGDTTLILDNLPGVGLLFAYELDTAALASPYLAIVTAWARPYTGG